MAEILSFRRVLILADESADWNVAGLRQLERLVLAVDEFALENNEKAPVLSVFFGGRTLMLCNVGCQRMND